MGHTGGKLATVYLQLEFQSFDIDIKIVRILNAQAHVENLFKQAEAFNADLGHADFGCLGIEWDAGAGRRQGNSKDNRCKGEYAYIHGPALGKFGIQLRNHLQRLPGIAATKQIGVIQNVIEVIERFTFRVARIERPRFLIRGVKSR